ncbi:hypothetical protein ULMS_05220 [Patiriisocius marinistellae]|uniref:Uncharacterized protein n=1 Tax=Patiriisocius marinistellae TaxID=2494560 RepID=A0A5J4FVA9_9FLAO|nr:hypothetical protein [Patiriisocius marinistellae]GEQ85014.1 hypothetical protein ULMS_05220 [Patiriisocius marinistellae]
MKGLSFLKKFAMHYIVLLFVTALIGQPVLNGFILANNTTGVSVNTVLEEENNEEDSDEETAEDSIDFHLPKLQYLILATSFIEKLKIPVLKEHSLVLDTFIPPPEVV